MIPAQSSNHGQVTKHISQPLFGFNVPQLPIQNKKFKFNNKKKKYFCSVNFLQVSHCPVLIQNTDNLKLIYFTSKEYFQILAPISVMLKSDRIEGNTCLWVQSCSLTYQCLEVHTWKHQSSVLSDCWLRTAAGRSSYHLASQPKCPKNLLTIGLSYNSRLRHVQSD